MRRKLRPGCGATGAGCALCTANRSRAIRLDATAADDFWTARRLGVTFRLLRGYGFLKDGCERTGSGRGGEEGPVELRPALRRALRAYLRLCRAPRSRPEHCRRSDGGSVPARARGDRRVRVARRSVRGVALPDRGERNRRSPNEEH